MDFGYTLAYLDEGSIRRYREELLSTLIRYGYSKELSDLTLILEDTYRNTKKGEAKDIYEFWKTLLKNLEISGSSTLIQELTELRKRHLMTRFRLYDSAALVLSTLRKKYKLALVSNCFVGLSDYLKALNLTRFFDCIILSYEIGTMKPDRHIYFEALQRLRLRPKECIFVSDSISDLEGAKEVGIQAFLISRRENTTYCAKHPNFKPDFKCKHISEIIEFL